MFSSRAPLTSPLLFASLLALGCDATLGGAFDDDGSSEASPQDASAADNPWTQASTNDPFAVVDEGCQPSTDLVAFPLRRLTNAEYATTVSDSFGVDSPESAEFEHDERTAGFAANWVAAVGDKHVEDYEAAAQGAAERILQNDPTFLRACPESGLSEGSAECVAERLLAATEKAYRRAPESDEMDALSAFHTAQTGAYGAEDADRMFLELLFQTPQFLYVAPPYAGTESESLAGRLAYFLTAAPPDEDLRESAATDALADPAELLAQVDRLLASERSRKALLSFFTQWLDMERLDEVVKDETVYGNWSEALRAEMFTETELFIEQTIESGGGLTELLTSRDSIVSPALADLYGVAAQHSGTGFQPVSLPEGERAGLLTQASFLAGHSHQVENSWVLRGDFVRRHMLCDELPPPPDVDLSVVNDAGRLDDPVCSGCHLMMDPIGQSFDRYDAVGRYKELAPDGAPIPTAGELIPGPEPLDISGDFESPLALAESLAQSASVQACITRQVFRFAHRRRDEDHERCGLMGIAQEFSESGGDLKSLMRAIATSPAMTHAEGAL